MGQYNVDEIEFYSNGWLDNIDLASVTNDELKDLTYYQVKQAAGTYNEMVSMEETDLDYAFWDNDYNNEKNNYMQLATELNNRGIEVPHTLDMHDNASQMNNVIERFTPGLFEYKDNVIVQADNELEAIKQIFNGDLETAIIKSYNLNGLPDDEFKTQLNQGDWNGVLEFEKENGFFKNIGNGLFTDEMVMLGVNSKHAVNASLFADKATDRTKAELRSFVANTPDLQTKHNLGQQHNAPSI